MTTHGAEARRAWELQQQAVIRELYFRADRDEAVLVLECEDVEVARAVLATLPLMEHGLIEFELIPLRAYPGFARPFAEEGQAERARGLLRRHVQHDRVVAPARAVRPGGGKAIAACQVVEPDLQRREVRAGAGR